MGAHMQTINAIDLDKGTDRATSREEVRLRRLRRCAPWTPGEDQSLIVVFRRGATIESLAALHCRDEHTVRTRLLELGEAARGSHAV